MVAVLVIASFSTLLVMKDTADRTSHLHLDGLGVHVPSTRWKGSVAKRDYLKNTFRWSDAEVRVAVAKAPTLLQRSKDTLRSRSEFLISEVGLEPVYIAHLPVIICLSLEGRLRPRHYVIKFLKENGLLGRDRSFATAVTRTHDVFMEKYICPHKEVAPHLAEDYAATCRGEVPAIFR